MSSLAISAFGCKLQRGDGAVSETFATIAEVRSMTWNMTAKQDDVTTHSTGTPWREFISSLLDPGTVVFSINFVPTDETQDYSSGILADFIGRTKSNYQFVFPDQGNTTWAFSAYVTDFKPDAKVDGVLEAAITLRLTGPPSFA